MNNGWKKSVIKPSDTILRAIEILNNEVLKVVLVVNDSGCLRGTITDGDIRR